MKVAEKINITIFIAATVLIIISIKILNHRNIDKEILKIGDKLEVLNMRDFDSVNVPLTKWISQKKRSIFIIFSPNCSACESNIDVWNNLQEKLDTNKWNLFGISESKKNIARKYVQINELKIKNLYFDDKNILQ